MLLSIVMMIKDEEKYLDNTLKALTSLMKRIDSELVILDTGSTDRSIEIANKYTKNIHTCKWNNDFADMRNKSISYAKGKWILILDADEVLEEYEKMIGFFEKELYKKYNSGSVVIKNVLSGDKDLYGNCHLIRFFKNDKDLKYTGKIHEQPTYTGPVYKDIVQFRHFGYVFEDEETRQRKVNRNKKILLEELRLNEDDPYIYYQLGKNYIVEGDLNEALIYMEQAYSMYHKLKVNYIPAKTDLANLYLRLKKYEQCIKICNDYIKLDNKNIDIYYYLAISQMHQTKHKESINSFERYLYLIENYTLSTQSNNLYATGETVSLKKNTKVNIINAHYELKEYELVLRKIHKLDEDERNQVQYIELMSLYKLNKFYEVLNLYENVRDSNTIKNKLLNSIENIMPEIKKDDKNRIYEILSKIPNNYGILNLVRLGEKIDYNIVKKIIIEEKASYYSELIYYLFKQGNDLKDFLIDLDNIKIYNYFLHLTIKFKESIIDFYEYLEKATITFDMKLLKVYSCLSKVLIQKGRFADEKLGKLFYMYIIYNYHYIKLIHNQDLSNNELISMVSLSEHKFILEYMENEKNKKTDALKYIRTLKELLINNKEYEKLIKISIKKFEDELNKGNEFLNLKKDYKALIESNINNNNLEDALKKIEDYEKMIGKDSEILNMKGIVYLLNQDINKASILFKESYMLDKNDFNTLFNIAHIKEISGAYKEALNILRYILSNCSDTYICSDSKKKVEELLAIK